MNAPPAPGALHPSAALEQVLAACRALADLAPARRGEVTPAMRQLGVVALAELEAALGLTLPNDVVALVTLGLPVLDAVTGLTLEGLRAPHQGRGGEAWVAIATGERAAAAPPGVGLAPGPLVLHLRRGEPREGDPRVLVVDELADEAARPRALSGYLRDRLATCFGDYWNAAVRLRDDATWRLALVDDRPPPAAERVVHPTFGPGVVARVLDGGKVEVHFDHGGPRTLLRRFLRDA